MSLMPRKTDSPVFINMKTYRGVYPIELWERFRIDIKKFLGYRRKGDFTINEVLIDALRIYCEIVEKQHGMVYSKGRLVKIEEVDNNES
jgi:hypothetical protein